ncbi:MAG: LysR substrate-binding domain-containing protein [Burkholderiales bacterium]
MLEISTRVLRAMIAVDELRHFSLAAERCNVTQSALSQMISKLEYQVDLRLVDRDRRRVSLTPEGERFVATARRVVSELEEISEDLRDHASMRKGRLLVSALPSLAAHWLPPAIARFQEKYPGIRVSVADAPPDRALEQVRHRQADFALTARGPGMVGFQHRLLFEDHFLLACHHQHPLAKRKKLLLADMAGHDYIRLIRSGSIAQHLAGFLHANAVNDSGLEVEQVATLAGLIGNNLGISLVPSMAVPYFNPKLVTTIPVTDANFTRPIYLVWRSAGSLGPAAQRFIDELPIPASGKGKTKAAGNSARPKAAMRAR